MTQALRKTSLVLTVLAGLCLASSLEAQAPPGPVFCDPIAGTNDVALAWTNNGPYFQIQIDVDGVIVATLPGTATFHTVTLPPGNHVICVLGIDAAGAVLQPVQCCDAFIPPPPPITDLFCDPIAGTTDVAIAWTNGGFYTSIKVEVDGAPWDTLPGNATFYTVTGLTPGGHTICVVGCVGPVPIGPPVCCDTAGGGPAGPIDPLLCDVIAGTNDVQLSWVNNGAYTSIDVNLDGVIVATLPGSDTSFLLTGLPPGPHTVCLRAFGALGPIAPDACCQFNIGMPPTIDAFVCDVIAGTNDVQLAWVNNGAYTSIEVVLDGALVDVLPGSDTSYLLTGVPPGGHTVCLRPFVGAMPVIPAVCCQFNIGMPPSVITDLICGPVPGAAGTLLTWTNNGPYGVIEIELNGTVIDVIPGTSTSYALGVLPPGVHTVCVTPFFGGAPILPPECCTIFIGTTFVRGDGNADGLFNIADSVFLLGFLFSGGAAPPCEDAGDANDDGLLNIADPSFILNNLFAGGPLPPPPHPSCGVDPTPDSIGCLSYPPCP